MFLTIRRYWRFLVIILTPLVLLPLPLLFQTKQAQCAYIVLLLTIYWISEAMPYAVASFLPLALFPMLTIVPGDLVAYSYFKDATTLFVGSMILAQAMEYVRLHRRLALLVLNFVGSSMNWSMAGLMGVTAFVSMWVNNSAATSIMIPAAMAIIDEVENFEKTNSSNRVQTPELKSTGTEMLDCKSTIPEQNGNQVLYVTNAAHPRDELILLNNPSVDYSTSKFNFRQLRAGFLLAVAYSSAIGGLMTLVGTPSNIFANGFVKETYDKAENFKFKISFGNFFIYAFPMGLVMLIFCWILLQIMYNRREFLSWKVDERSREVGRCLQAVFRAQYRNLEPLTWSEIMIVLLFIIVIILWLIRDFSGETWLYFFEKRYATDGTIALFVGVLPLILPNKNPFRDDWIYQPILPWSVVSETFPWGVFILQGAGTAIADGFQASNLAATMGKCLGFIVGAPPTLIILFATVLSAVLTEFSSNLACASILFPIFDSIARAALIHPAYLILPSCMAVSLSFMLPIATPSDAMVMETGHVKVADLMEAGIFLKLFGIVVIFVESIFVIQYAFHIDNIQLTFNSTRVLNTTFG